jgi:hypothetical protein
MRQNLIENNIKGRISPKLGQLRYTGRLGPYRQPLLRGIYFV